MRITSEKRTEKKLHTSAKSRVKMLTDEFQSSLIAQAKILAHQKGDDIVLPSHVDEALAVIRDKQRYKRSKELAKAIGGILFGLFIPGFVSALGSGNTLSLTLFTLSGLLGILLMTWSLRA
jgi:uncharacterized protein (DUF1778 family)